MCIKLFNALKINYIEFGATNCRPTFVLMKGTPNYDKPQQLF